MPPSPSDYTVESRERWARVAPAWERRESEQWDATEAVSRNLVERLDLQPGDAVLELAGGVGHTSMLAAERVAPGGRVIATDFADAMVEAARRLADSTGAQGVEHRVMDAQAIDLPDTSVDGVLCRWGLMLFADPARAVAEIRRVLRPGGRFGCAVWASAQDNPWASVVGRVFVTRGLMEPPEPGAPGMFSLADTELLEALLRGAGFESVAVEDVPVRFRYESFDEYWQVTRELGGGIADALARLPESERDAVRAEVELGTEAFRTAGGFEFPRALPQRDRVVTYSIVARDPETGELGVAVQTRAFAVGNAVPWASPKVGAVATQSFTERSYGPLALELLRIGRAPEDALAGLVRADPQQAVRQVGVVDTLGRTAAHTGVLCIPEAGHITGDGFSVQANMMRSAEVWPAMAEAFTGAAGSLPQRLLAALDAAEAAGGDFRGRQAAAMLVVAGETSGRTWDEHVVDVRVDDHPEPLAELRRLVGLTEAYRGLVRGEVDEEDARRAGVRDDELEWLAVAAAWRTGDLETARRRFGLLTAREPRWEAAWKALELIPPPDLDE